MIKNGRYFKAEEACSRQLQAAFLRLQQIGIIQIKVNVVSLDSTSIKVHPDGMGSLKKAGPNLSEEHGEDGIPSFIWSPHLIGMG